MSRDDDNRRRKGDTRPTKPVVHPEIHGSPDDAEDDEQDKRDETAGDDRTSEADRRRSLPTKRVIFKKPRVTRDGGDSEDDS